MKKRYSDEDVEIWRKEGAVVIPQFFKNEEIIRVVDDFEKIFPGRRAEAKANEKRRREELKDQPTSRPSEKKLEDITAEQFKNFEMIPFDCSSALNLIAVHPQLIDFARKSLRTEDVRLYQAQAWAKFTGETDFDQAFHCDFLNHTLTVPSRDECLNSITFIMYFTDVTEAHGPTHYVTRSDSQGFDGMKRFLTPHESLGHQRELGIFERSAAGPAGTVLAYGIDVFHRGTNLTEPGGCRYAVTSCFKKAGNDAIGYTTWPRHFERPWQGIFEHATPEQLTCFGVPLPGDSFWTEDTLSLAQLRYPSWDMSEYLR